MEQKEKGYISEAWEEIIREDGSKWYVPKQEYFDNQQPRNEEIKELDKIRDHKESKKSFFRGLIKAAKKFLFLVLAIGFLDGDAELRFWMAIDLTVFYLIYRGIRSRRKRSQDGHKKTQYKRPKSAWYKDPEQVQYEASTYYFQTKLPYKQVIQDKGRYGEYLTYLRLRDYELAGGKFLFNLYIPKGNNETTEIDVLLITSRGLFVFESKNYSGWIFGEEHQQNWTQTLFSRRGAHKEHFYNPIMQNKAHIKHLRSLVGKKVPIRSVIVFSERCTLRDVKVSSEDIRVINRYDIVSTVSSLYIQMPENQLSEMDMLSLFEVLRPYTTVSQETKDRHNERIRKYQ